MKGFHVYIMTNEKHTVLYTGVTNDLGARLYEHITGKPGSFSFRYRVMQLVYFEEYATAMEAIAREKQIKGGSRQDKLDLVNGFNPDWLDLSEQVLDPTHRNARL